LYVNCFLYSMAKAVFPLMQPMGPPN
jgi:hypothetical protein